MSPAGPLRLQEIEIFGTPIPQMAPGQALFLFRLDLEDLYVYPDGGGKPIGVKEDSFTIAATYNGPNRGLNWIPRFVRGQVGKKQYEESYTFNPKIVQTDLPAPEYSAG